MIGMKPCPVMIFDGPASLRNANHRAAPRAKQSGASA